MPRNGSGSYSLPELPFTPGTTISSAAVNDDFSDIATALTGSVAADGQTPISGGLKGADGSNISPSYSFNTETNTGFYKYGAGQVGLSLLGALGWIFSSTGAVTATGISIGPPIGTVNDFAGSTAPSGWLLCYGQAVSRTTYSRLFAVVGSTYGNGDGSTTFNLPDCRGRAGVGKDDMGGVAANRITTGGCGIDGTSLGANGGEQTHTLTTPEIPAHSHTITDPGHSHTITAPFQASSGANQGVIASTGTSFTGTSTTGITINNAGGGGAHNNTQPTIIFNKIIFVGV